MAASVKYEGSSTFVAYQSNSYLLRGADTIIIQNGHVGTIFAYYGNDTVNGSAGSDQVYGGAGNDSMLGNNGADTLFGQDGADSIFGGTGDNAADKLYGENGNDLLVGGGGSDSLYGGADNDLLSGNAGDDDVFGGAGNDSLFADGGWDYLKGEDGDDTYQIQAVGKSEIWETTGSADVIVFNATSYAGLDYVQQGNDLWIATSSAIASGTFTSGTIVYDFFFANSNTVEFIAVSDGIVHAMSDFLLTA